MRHAFRRLISTPAFSLAAAITLAAAIGANALIFSVVNGVLLKPLPFADPARLVGVWHVAPGIAPGPMNQAPSTYFMYREDARVFEDIGLWDDTSVTITGRGNPEQIKALMVTDGTFPIVGVRAATGVQSVGVSSSITMDGGSSNDPIFVEDFPRPDGSLPPLRRFKWIGERYFETMGNSVIAGRPITWSDIHNATPIAMVSENFAREFWGEPSKAVGRRIRQNPKNPWREIVGVVGNEQQDGITQNPPSIIYWPLLLTDFWDNAVYTQRGIGYAIRTSRLQSPGFLAEVQQAVWSVNANLPLARVRTLREIYDDTMSQTSFTLVILGIAARVTLLLGVVGIYGVIAYVVVQRRREIGIRIALGARASEVQRMFLTRGLLVTAVGLIVGTGAAIGVVRFLTAVLFGVSPFDPPTFAAVIAGLGTIALIATWLPARQATKIDPAVALRGD